MGFLHLALLIVGGTLASSTFIVAKRPTAAPLLAKLTTHQAWIGVALLVVSIFAWLHAGIIDIFRLLKWWPIGGVAEIGAVFSGILLGALFGMPQIAKWMNGESPAATKALAWSQKVRGIQMLVAIVALASGFLVLLIELGILRP